MKSTGIIRKIDELGRIVIPKEMRNSLNIKTGDDLAFLVEDNKIILEKYQKMDNIKDISHELLNSVRDLVDANILVTNTERILTSGEYQDKLLPLVLVQILNERKNYCSSVKEILKFEDKVMEGFFLFYPIIDQSSPIGLLVMVKDNPITKEDELFLKLLKNIIENK